MSKLLAALDDGLFALAWDISVAEQGLALFHESGKIKHLLTALGGIRSARSALALTDAAIAKTSAVRACRVCGCTHTTPCIDPRTGISCHWVARDLCSACAPARSRARKAGRK